MAIAAKTKKPGRPAAPRITVNVPGRIPGKLRSTVASAAKTHGFKAVFVKG
jgi:hypothetical protein